MSEDTNTASKISLEAHFFHEMSRKLYWKLNYREKETELPL